MAAKITRHLRGIEHGHIRQFAIAVDESEFGDGSCGAHTLRPVALQSARTGAQPKTHSRAKAHGEALQAARSLRLLATLARRSRAQCGKGSLPTRFVDSAVVERTLEHSLSAVVPRLARARALAAQLVVGEAVGQSSQTLRSSNEREEHERASSAANCST